MRPPDKLSPLAFARGAAAPLTALAFIWRHTQLWWLAFLPFIINLALFAVFFWFSYTHLGQWVRGLLPAGQGWWWQALIYLLLVLLFLALLALEVYLFAVVGRVVCEPFLELLTRRTERLVPDAPLGAPAHSTGLLRDLLRVVRQSILRLLLFLAVMLPLLLVNLLPGLGGLIYAALAWLVTSFFLALEFMDYPLDRRGLGLRQKLAYVRGMGLGWLGFGSAALVLGLVPLVNFALLPLAAVGGTLLYLERPLPPKA